MDLVQRRVSVRGTGSKFGTVGLPQQATAALHRWRETVIGARGRKHKPDDPVFCTGRPEGGLRHSDRLYVFDWPRPLGKWAVRKIVARRADSADLGVVATHDLRRSFAGFLDEQGWTSAASRRPCGTRRLT